MAFTTDPNTFARALPRFFGGANLAFNFRKIEGLISGRPSDNVDALRAAVVVHEGKHATDFGFWFRVGGEDSQQGQLNMEGRGVNAESLFYQTMNIADPRGNLWNPAWLQVDREKVEQMRRRAVETETEARYGGKPELQY